MVEIACQVIMETERAYQIDDGATKCWVPKSQVEWHPDDAKGNGTMVMPEFIAKEKGLI